MTGARPAASGREALIVLGFTLALFLPFVGKALHNDEPVFATIGRHILERPLDPLGFDYYWFGRTLPMKRINTTPPGFHYLMAGVYGLAGGREVLMRLAFLPLVLLAAWSLLAIGRRFLEEPLLPVLIVIACPAFLINMGHLMPEAPSVALGWLGLALLPAAVEDRREALFWLSAAALGFSVVFKYNAGLLLVPAVCYGLWAGVPARRMAAFAAAACLPAAAVLARDLLTDRAFAGRAWEVAVESNTGWWSSLSHKGRSFLAFAGGCGVVTFLWPFLPRLAGRPTRLRLALAAGVACLFLPWFDLASVRLVDRLAGAAMALGALLCWEVMLGDDSRGRRFWLAWLAAGAAMQVFLYWSVMSRVTLHMVPPMVFGLWAALERSMPARGLRRLALASLAATAGLSLALADVDYRYASASRDFALEAGRAAAAAGRTIRFTGAMGLQYYLEASGGRGLEVTSGGWDALRPGDRVAVLRINTVPSRPSKPRPVSVRGWAVSHPVPLRLMSGFDGEGGFYSNLSGFLPYSPSREPLEEFSVMEFR